MSTLSMEIELQNSRLTKAEFAMRIGVEVSRLNYWLELERFRDELQRRYEHDLSRNTPSLRGPCR